MKTKLSIFISLTFLVLLIGSISQNDVVGSNPSPQPEGSYIYVTLSAAGTSDYCDIYFQGKLDDGGWVYSFIHDDQSPYTFNSSGVVNKMLSYWWVYLKVRVGVTGPVYTCGDNQLTYYKESPWYGSPNGTGYVSAYINLNPDYPFNCPEI